LITNKESEDIPAAREIVIELKPLCDKKWIRRKINDYGKEAFLKSVARRAKEFLYGKLVAEDHIGTFPKEVVWEGASIGWDTDYKIVATEPKGEVWAVLKTKVICKLE
jgi:hypothetical protein